MLSPRNGGVRSASSKVVPPQFRPEMAGSTRKNKLREEEEKENEARNAWVAEAGSIQGRSFYGGGEKPTKGKVASCGYV